MSNKKQTAVEWLVAELNRVQELYYGQSITPIEVVSKAKELEKQQMIDFGNDLLAQNDVNYIGSPNLAEQYFNETFE